MGKVYVGDEGTEIILDTGEDVTGATTLEIRARKPDETEVQWTATDYQTTKARYVIQAGDLDQAGLWRFQAYGELASWTGLGDTVERQIYDPFD